MITAWAVYGTKGRDCGLVQWAGVARLHVSVARGEGWDSSLRGEQQDFFTRYVHLGIYLTTYRFLGTHGSQGTPGPP